MDTSKERIEGLKKCKALQKCWWTDGGKRLMSGDIYDKKLTDPRDSKKPKHERRHPLDIELPSIGELLKILKGRGWYPEMIPCFKGISSGWDVYWKVQLVVNNVVEDESFEAPTLERALDQVCEWVLNNA